MIEAYLVIQDGQPLIIRSVRDQERPLSIPIVLVYLAEGGANVVYQLTVLAAGSSSPVLSRVDGKLLRLRKNKSFIANTREQYETFQRSFQDLFPSEHLVGLSLVILDHGVLKAVNENLQHLEHLQERSQQRHGDLIATEEPYGLLIDDMTPTGPEILIEIKPKWLCQSPDAPNGSRRCRTCALRAQRKAAREKGEVVPVLSNFCPLALVSTDIEDQKTAADAILRARDAKADPFAASNLAMLLVTRASELLNKLRAYQMQYDPTGILDVAPDSIPGEDFSKAMTLRDCTLFIRSRDETFDRSSRLCLSDLDLKQPSADKIRRWRSTERQLIDEGWYTNTEQDLTPENICILSRKMID